MIISCCSAAALQVGTPLHNDYTNRVRYSCPSSNGHVKNKVMNFKVNNTVAEAPRKRKSTQMHPWKPKPTPRKMCGTFRGSEWEYTGIVRGFWTPPKWHCRHDMWTCEPSGSDDKWVLLVSLAQGRSSVDSVDLDSHCTVVLWGSQSWPKTGLAAYRPRCGFAALGYMQRYAKLSLQTP